jgi:hypothetical protein
MKLVLLVYYVALQNEMMELLAKLNLCTYTRVPEVQGRISCGDPREDSHVWPGVNSILLVPVDDDKVDALLRAVEGFNQGRVGEGADAYVLDIAKSVSAA